MAKEGKAHDSQAASNDSSSQEVKECFIIMPISDPDNYEAGHFAQVYNDLIEPACKKAGFKATRADQVKETNLIHVDILKRLIDAPMAICDLSSRNPNVLFELGIRQAFDKPVVLIQEKNTPRIFDISPLRAIDYRPELKYREVLNDQALLAETLLATEAAIGDSSNFNSLVQLLSLTAAKLPSLNADDTESVQMQLIREELGQVKGALNMIVGQLNKEGYFPNSVNDGTLSFNAACSAFVQEYFELETIVDVQPFVDISTRKRLINLQTRVRMQKTRDDSRENKDKLTRLDKQLNTLLSAIKDGRIIGSSSDQPPF